MSSYEKMYLHLFNEVSTAIGEIERCNYGTAAERLLHAQLVCEEMFMQNADKGEVRQDAAPDRNANTGIVLLP